MGKLAYWLDFLDELSEIHKTFSVSQLQKCVVDESALVPMDDILVDDRLNCVERPVVILYRKKKDLRNKEVSLVNV